MSFTQNIPSKDMSAPDNNKKPSDPEKDDSSLDQTDDLNSLYEVSDYIQGADSQTHEVYPGAERLEYDFVFERQNANSTNLIESTSHLIKGCLGAGILSMHEGYMLGGLWASLAATLLIGTIVPYNMSMLVSSAQKLYARLRVPRLTYPDLVEVAVATGPLKCCRKHSRLFRYTLELCLFTELCGTCCIYQIMIAETLKLALEKVSSQVASWNLTIRMYILIFMVPLLIVCLIRNLKYLAPFSLSADLFLAICVIATTYYSLSKAGGLAERPAFKSFHGLAQFCGILIYSIDGVGITMTIENHMARPQYFYLVLQFGMSIVIVTVTLIGFFGYWGFGESCRSPFTLQMPLDTVPLVLEFLLVAILAVTFALNFWITFRIIWHYISRRYKNYRRRGWLERIYRGLFLILLTCASVAYPNMIKLMIFMGNFFLTFVTFMFPAMIETFVTWRDHRGGRGWRLFKNGLIFTFGILLNVCGFYSITR